jgi:hypothetical protein
MQHEVKIGIFSHLSIIFCAMQHYFLRRTNRGREGGGNTARRAKPRDRDGTTGLSIALAMGGK